MTIDGAASLDDIGGRAAWSFRLLTPTGEPINLAFGDATGLLVRVANADGMVLL